MEYIDTKNLTELESKYLYKFHHSKCLDTLDKQCELLELRYNDNKAELNAINYAWCVRESELKKKGSPVFKNGNEHSF